MEKKYLFFDIDGTLTNRATGGIVPSAKEALQRLEEWCASRQVDN